MILIAFDPGLDEVAGAVFDTDRIPAERDPRDVDGYLAAAHALVTIARCKTSPRDPISRRCGILAQWAYHVCGEHGAELAYIEMPPIWHAKTMKKQGTGGVLKARAKLNRALGALMAGLARSGVTVNEVPADRGRKEARRDRVDHLMRMAGKPRPPTSDTADAAWYGLRATVEVAELGRGAFA